MVHTERKGMNLLVITLGRLYVWWANPNHHSMCKDSLDNRMIRAGLFHNDNI